MIIKKLNTKKYEWCSVESRYVRRFVREHAEAGDYKAIKLFCEGMIAKGKRMYWKRDSL